MLLLTQNNIGGFLIMMRIIKAKDISHDTKIYTFDYSVADPKRFVALSELPLIPICFNTSSQESNTRENVKENILQSLKKD